MSLLREHMGFALLIAALTAPAYGQQTIYRWLNPETGQYVTTPDLPPYPIKEKRPGANLSGIDLWNVDLDKDAPAFKAAIAKREAEQAEERHKEQERAERKAQQEQVEKEFREHQYQAEQDAYRAQCPGTLSFGISLGMTGDQVIFCLRYITMNNGRPDKINTTHTASGLREQWVYRISSGNIWYLYFDDGRLTAIQQ